MRIQRSERHTVAARSGAALSAKTQAHLDGILQDLQRQGKIVLGSEIEGPEFIRGQWQNVIIILWEAETDDPLYQRSLRQKPTQRHWPVYLGLGVLIALVIAILIVKP